MAGYYSIELLGTIMLPDQPTVTIYHHFGKRCSSSRLLLQTRVLPEPPHATVSRNDLRANAPFLYINRSQDLAAGAEAANIPCIVVAIAGDGSIECQECRQWRPGRVADSGPRTLENVSRIPLDQR